MQIKSRNMLSKKDKKILRENLENIYGTEIASLIETNTIIEEIKTSEGNFLVNEGKIWFFDYENQKIPSIHYLRMNQSNLPKIVVDTGAIRFITNGADVMAPGIVFFDQDISKNSVISIHEEKADSLLGIGISLVDYDSFQKTKQGRVIKTIHYLTDNIWKFQI
ncbi:DUF1947 domain-containing protein [Candidatus Heimdallarchaeota archaeon]|nr:MAG: DUF1947 domain-containing protein [Candidatus Heimdallarchaeota archaeon]